MSNTVDGDTKRSAIEFAALSRIPSRDITSNLTSVEVKSFASVNASIGWLGLKASILCAKAASRLQQAASGATI